MDYNKESLKLHESLKGKIELKSKVDIKDKDDPSLPIKLQHFVNRTTYYIFNI